MEQKLVKVPFDIEMAKKITNGEVGGKIVARSEYDVRVICWDKRSDSNYHIVALIDCGTMDRIFTYNAEGFEVAGKESEHDLFLEIPEYLTFKEGDIIKFSNDTYTWLSIIKNIDLSDDGRGGLLYFSNDYACIMINDGNEDLEFNTYSDAACSVEKATESEKQRLIDVLKESADPLAKEYLKRFFDIENSPKLSNSSNIGKNFELKPFDKVLVRDTKDEKWKPAFFWCKTDFFRTIGFNDWTYCIPYEGNEHLLNTTNDYKEE